MILSTIWTLTDISFTSLFFIPKFPPPEPDLPQLLTLTRLGVHETNEFLLFLQGKDDYNCR